MGETLNEQCRVSDEGPSGCKTLLFGKAPSLSEALRASLLRRAHSVLAIVSNCYPQLKGR